MRALLEDLVGEHDPVISADLHMDASLLLERADDCLRELGMLAVVEGDRGCPAPSGGCPAAGGEKGRGDDCPGGHGEPPEGARHPRPFVSPATHLRSPLPRASSLPG